MQQLKNVRPLLILTPLVVLLLCIAPTAFAEDSHTCGTSDGGDSACGISDCDIERVLIRSYELMKQDGQLELARTTLEQASSCPGGDIDYDVGLYLALVNLRLGRAMDAARGLEQLIPIAKSDGERNRATGLLELVRRDLYTVTFSMQDGSKETAAVQIRSFDSSTLPEKTEVKNLLERRLQFMAEGLYPAIIKRAQQVCRDGEIAPLAVVLPRGVYELSTGQQLTVEGSGHGIIFPISDVRPPRLSSLGELSVASVLALNEGTTVVGFKGLAGIKLSQIMRLGQGALLIGDVAWLPTALGADNCNPEALDECAAGLSLWSAGAMSVSHATQVGVGVGKQLLLAQDLPVTMSLVLRALVIPGGIAANSSDSSGTTDLLFIAPTVTPDIKIMRRLQFAKNMDGYWVGSTSLGVGTGFFRTQSSWQFPDFSIGQRLILFPQINAGALVRF